MGRKRKKKNKLEAEVEDIIIDARHSSQAHKDKIHDIAKGTNETAHRILDIAEDTKEIAGSANDKVHEQGKQIDAIGETIVDTHFTVKKAKSSTKSINSVWHAIGHAIKKFFTPKCLQTEKVSIDDSVEEFQTTRDKQMAQKGKGHAESESDHRSPAITILFDSKTQALEDDTYNTLTTVEDVLGEMNDLARQTNKEVRRQNRVLEQEKDIVDETNAALDKTNSVAKKYLRS